MKTLSFLALSALVFSQTLYAGSHVEVERLANRAGTFKSTYNGKDVPDETGLNCKIQLESYNGDNNIVSIQAGLQFTPNANLDKATTSSENGYLIYKTTESGKRPGGSVCGDVGFLTSYKKYVIVGKNSLTVTQEFRCNLIEKSLIEETCIVK